MNNRNLAGYSADTEVLTRAGWKLIAKLDDADEVATRSPAGCFEWQRPSERYRAPFDGEMVEFSSKSIDLLVRPEHQMLVRRPDYYIRKHPQAAGRDWHLRPASYFAEHPTSWFVFPATSCWVGGESPEDFVLEAIEADRRHPEWDRATAWLAGQLTAEWTRSGELEAAAAEAGISSKAYIAARANLGVKKRRRGSTRHGKGVSWWETSRPTREHAPSCGAYNPAPELRIPMKAFCAFLGLFLAEGWVRRDRDEILVAQYQTSRHLPEIFEIMDATGMYWVYNERTSKFTISHRRLAAWLRGNAGTRAWGKRVPDGFKDLSASLLAAMLSGMMIGDGHWGPCNQRYYTTTSPQLADDVQEIFQKTGADAWVRPSDMVTEYEGRFGRQHRQVYVVRERMQTFHMLPASAMREYHGNVHRLTVPNGIIYVRRNGRPAWCVA